MSVQSTRPFGTDVLTFDKDPRIVMGHLCRMTLETLMANLQYDLVAESYAIPAHRGKSMTIDRPELLDDGLEEIGELSNTEPRVPTWQSTKVTLKSYGIRSVVSRDSVYFSDRNVLSNLSTALATSAMQGLQKLLRSTLDSTTSQIMCHEGTKNSAKGVTEISAEDLETAILALGESNAPTFTQIIDATTAVGTQPVDNAYICFIALRCVKDLEAIPGFIKSVEYASGTRYQFNGEVGSYKKIRFIATNDPVTSKMDNGTKVYHNPIVAHSALVMTGGPVDQMDMRSTDDADLVRQNPINARIDITTPGGHTDPYNRLMQMALSFDFGSALTRSDLVINLKCSSTVDL